MITEDGERFKSFPGPIFSLNLPHATLAASCFTAKVCSLRFVFAVVIMALGIEMIYNGPGRENLRMPFSIRDRLEFGLQHSLEEREDTKTRQAGEFFSDKNIDQISGSLLRMYRVLIRNP